MSDRPGPGVFRSRIDTPFLYWLVISVPIFTVVATALESLDVRAGLALAIGIVISDLVFDPILEWFLEWRDVRRKLENQ